MGIVAAVVKRLAVVIPVDAFKVVTVTFVKAVFDKVMFVKTAFVLVMFVLYNAPVVRLDVIFAAPFTSSGKLGLTVFIPRYPDVERVIQIDVAKILVKYKGATEPPVRFNPD